MIYKCNEDFTYLLLKLYKFYFCFDTRNSNLPNNFGYTIIYINNLLIQMNDDYIAIEFDNFCISFYFKKLTNEHLLNLYLNNDFIIMKKLCSDLYLGIWEND